MPSDLPRPPRKGQDPPASRHLKLVSKDPPPKRKPYKRVGPPFSPEEEDRLRAVLRTARGLFGSWACLADALRMSLKGLRDAANGKVHISGDIVIRLSRALGVSAESLYKPGLRVVPFPSICPSCGRGPT